MTTITITVVDNLPAANALSNVTVRVYNQAGDNFVTQLITNASGQVTYDIPDGIYWVRFYKKGYAFESKTLIDVDTNETNSWLITAQNLTELPPSRAAGICRVSGYIIDAQGAPSYLPIITFSLPTGTRVMGNSIIGTEKLNAQPDNNGYIEVELLQNAVYSVTMASISDEVVLVKVPETQACGITDLVYPRGICTPIPTSLSITKDTKTTTGITVSASSGISLPDTDLDLSASSLVSFSSTTEIAVTIEDNVLFVTGSKEGTYSIKIYSEFCKRGIGVSPILLGTLSVVVNA